MLLFFLFPFILSSLFFLCCGEVELQAPTGPEVSTQLGLWTGFLPHEFGGRVSQNDISTFNFQTTQWNRCVLQGLQNEVQK